MIHLSLITGFVSAPALQYTQKDNIRPHPTRHWHSSMSLNLNLHAVLRAHTARRCGGGRGGGAVWRAPLRPPPPRAAGSSVACRLGMKESRYVKTDKRFVPNILHFGRFTLERFSQSKSRTVIPPALRPLEHVFDASDRPRPVCTWHCSPNNLLSQNERKDIINFEK